MHYEKHVIDRHIIVYHLDPKTIHSPPETDLDIINRFFSHHIPSKLDKEHLEIRKQFYNFRLHINGFISSAFFGNPI